MQLQTDKGVEDLLKEARSNQTAVIAGPCAVEGKHTVRMAESLKDIKADEKPLIKGLRGGAYKPRTSPDSFQGLKEEGLEILKEAKEKTNLPIVTEVMDPRHIEEFLEAGVDVFQVGSRNMHNQALLKELAEHEFPILMKRGFASNFRELKGAVKYLKRNHESRPVLVCLRGLKKMDFGNEKISELRDSMPHQHPDFRFFNDVEDIPEVKSLLSDIPNTYVGFDPSHIAGDHRFVPELIEMGIEFDSDFLIVETLPKQASRKERKCDGGQAVTADTLEEVLKSAI